MAKTTSVKYKENPFLKDLVICKKSKQVRISNLGKDDNILINQSTGEVKGTHVVTYKQVDNAEFVKLFAANVALTFELKSAGIKAFNVMVWAVQNFGINKDVINLDLLILEDFLNENDLKLSPATFYRGLKELEKSGIVARTLREGQFFTNPNFLFNGDRIAFTTVLEKRAKDVSEQHKQMDAFEVD